MVGYGLLLMLHHDYHIILECGSYSLMERRSIIEFLKFYESQFVLCVLVILI